MTRVVDDDHDVAAVQCFLVALPGHEEAAEAMRMSTVFARWSRVPITLIMVAEEPPVGRASMAPIAAPWSLMALRDDNIETAHKRCQRAVRQFSMDVSVDYRVECGRPDQVIDAAIARACYTAIFLHGPWIARYRVRRAMVRWQMRGIAIHLI